MYDFRFEVATSALIGYLHLTFNLWGFRIITIESNSDFVIKLQTALPMEKLGTLPEFNLIRGQYVDLHNWYINRDDFLNWFESHQPNQATQIRHMSYNDLIELLHTVGDIPDHIEIAGGWSLSEDLAIDSLNYFEAQECKSCVYDLFLGSTASTMLFIIAKYWRICHQQGA